MTGAVVTIAKAPVAGRVKTRLCPPLRPTEAAELAAAMVADTSEMAAGAGLDPWCAHAGDPVALRALVPPGTHMVPQRGRGLADRLSRTLLGMLAAGYARVVMIGGDCPTLTRGDILEAASALDDHDVVLGPALDGGYTLIGATRWHRGLFEGVEMGSDRVLTETLSRAASTGLSTALVGERRDLDTAEDLLLALDRGELDHAPRTRALLERWGSRRVLSSLAARDATTMSGWSRAVRTPTRWGGGTSST